jgi:hypothetical protein
MRSRSGRWAVLPLVAALGLAGCAGGANTGGIYSSPSPTPSAGPTASASPFTSSTFQPAFTAVLPPGVELDLENEHFVSWNSTENSDDRIRVVQPVSYYAPGSTQSAAPPADYNAYLDGLAAKGVRFEDVTTMTLDGRQAQVGTMTTDTGLDGALGCWAADATQDDVDRCFGPQPDLTLRLAAVDVAGTPVLLWARSTAPGPDEAFFAAFEEMLGTVHFTG